MIKDPKMREKIIEAIQSQKKMEISFRKETTEKWAIRRISPYDVYPREDRESGESRELLIGYIDADVGREAHVFSTYLDNIYVVEVLNEKFDGSRIKELVGAKGSPNIERDW